MTLQEPPPRLSFKGQELALELVDAGSVTLVRAYSHPAADWHPPPVPLRNNHIDPPPGYGDEFAVLYTASNIQSSAMEVRALFWDQATNRAYWNPAAAQGFQVVRYALGQPGLFIPIDGPNRRALGLQGKFEPDYESSRWVALELHRRYGHLVHGLSYESFHRYQPGRVYAIWHARKHDLALQASQWRPRLAADPEFQAFLAAHPFIRPTGTRRTLSRGDPLDRIPV